MILILLLSVACAMFGVWLSVQSKQFDQQQHEAPREQAHEPSSRSCQEQNERPGRKQEK